MIRSKSSRAVLSVVLAGLMAVVFMPAISYTSFAATARKATKITKVYHAKSTTYKKTVGSAWTLKYKLSPSKLTSSAKKVVWKVSEPDVAKVSNKKAGRYGKAKVTFLDAGYVTVTVKAKNNPKVKTSWKFKVTKEEEPTTTTLTGVTVSAPNASAPATEVKAGTTLNATVAPADAKGVTYQWYADDTAITGATDSTFKVTTDQIGKAITVKAKSENEVASTATAKVSFETLATVGLVTVTKDSAGKETTGEVPSADFAVGTVLRVATGAADVVATAKAVDTNIADIQWYRVSAGGNGNTVETAITGATGTDYTATSADMGYVLEAKVTPKTNVLGVAQTATTSEYKVANSLQLTVGAKTTNNVVGDTLALTYKDSSSNAVPAAESALNYQWVYCNAQKGPYTAITGATSSTYKADKVGYYEVIVTVPTTNTYYSVGDANAKVTTVGFDEVKTAPKATLPTPTIVDQTTATTGQTGIAVGDSLYASIPGITETLGNVTYQWYKLDASGNRVALNTSSTSNPYTLETVDNGTKIVVGVTASTGLANTNYAGSTVYSDPVTVTAQKLPITITQKTFTLASTGDEDEWKVGQKVSFSGITYAKADIGTKYTVTWTLVDANGNKVRDLGTNADTYTIQSNDVGYKVKVTLTGIGNYAGRSITATSECLSA